MKPTRPRDDAVVDLLDVLLRDGVVLTADVVITVADVPLVGIKLRAAIAGMQTMTDHGMLVDLDRRKRREIRSRHSRADGEAADVDPKLDSAKLPGDTPTAERPD